MPVTPKFLAARQEEQRNRLIAHLPQPPALDFPVRRPPGRWARLLSWLRCPTSKVRVPICHLTERHRLELTFAQNAFFTDLAPTLGDVQLFLWRLSPLFMRPDGTFPNAPQGSIRNSRIAIRNSARLRRHLARYIPHIDLHCAETVIQSYLATTAQDFQGGEDTPAGSRVRSRLLPDTNYFDDLTDYVMATWHMTRAEVLDTPRALLFQLHRNQILREPEGHLKVFAPSDRFLAS
jgi:hypothetical protein